MSPMRRMHQLVFVLACATIMWLTFPRPAAAAQSCSYCDTIVTAFYQDCPNSDPDEGSPTTCSGQATGVFESEYCREVWRQQFRCYYCPLCNL
jgi:hypothetical protein